jgi:hypothetical protein
MSLRKIAQTVAQSIFLSKNVQKFYRAKEKPKVFGYFCILEENALCKQSPNGRRRKFDQSGDPGTRAPWKQSFKPKCFVSRLWSWKTKCWS